MYVRTLTFLALAIPAWAAHPPIGNWRVGDERDVTASWASIGRETYEHTMKKDGKTGVPDTVIEASWKA